jgi:hypothetical protein
MPIAYAPTRKPKLSASQYAARYSAERARQQQRYCDAFEMWRRCANKRCRRECGCRGDALACLKRLLVAVSHQAQWQARQRILAATPQNIGAPERAARQCMPLDFLAETAAEAAAAYFARFTPKQAGATRRQKGGGEGPMPPVRLDCTPRSAMSGSPRGL